MDAGRPRTGRRWSSDDRLVELPDGLTVLDLTRQGLPAALELGTRLAAEVPDRRPRSTPCGCSPPSARPTVRDFVAFEEHVEGVRRRASTAAPACARAGTRRRRSTSPTRYALIGAHDDVAGAAGLRAARLRARGRRRHRAGTGRRPDARAGAATTSSATRSSTTGRPATCRRREMQVGLGPAKGKDSATTLGPWLVTADELEPYRDDEGFLALELTRRGQRRGDRPATCSPTWAGRSRSSSPTPRAAPRSVPATCSARAPAATAAASASCGAAGGLTPPPLQAGDVVTMTVEGIGTVTNRVGRAIEVPQIPRRARPRPGLPRRAAPPGRLSSGRG